MSGWIKLHRTLQAWGWKTKPFYVAVFIDLLLEANHQDGEYMGVKIPRGSLTTSVEAIVKRTGVTESRVKTILGKLKASGEISSVPTTKYTMISITNWAQYQSTIEQNDEQLANKDQTTSKQVSTNKNVIIKESKNTCKPEALVIEYYNQMNGRSLRQVDSNYKEIRARLKEGYSIDEMKMLIDYTSKVWNSDPFWSDKNRPCTLFSGKFDGYLQTAKAAINPKLDPLEEFALKHMAKGSNQ